MQFWLRAQCEYLSLDDAINSRPGVAMGRDIGTRRHQATPTGRAVVSSVPGTLIT